MAQDQPWFSFFSNQSTLRSVIRGKYYARKGRVIEVRKLVSSSVYVMTTNAKEETISPEVEEMLWLDGSVGRALGTNPKFVGLNLTPVEVFATLTTHPCLA